jgi:hypothetical protein
MSFHIVVIFSAVVSVSIIAAYACLQSVGRYKKENAALRGQIRDAAEMIARLGEHIAKDKNIQQEANNERQELENTADGGLERRANALFGGVRDEGGTGGAA